MSKRIESVTGPVAHRAGRREWIGLAVLHLAVPAISADLRPSSAQLLWLIDIYGFFVAGEVHGRNADPARHMIGLDNDDIQADWQRLKDAGVEFIEDPTAYGSDMTIATLKDPEGNLVQLWNYHPS